MEGEKGNNALWWFIVGYWTAIIIEEIVAPALSSAINALVTTSEPTGGTVVLESPNGTTGEQGETVSSLVKETEENV